VHPCVVLESRSLLRAEPATVPVAEERLVPRMGSGMASDVARFYCSVPTALESAHEWLLVCEDRCRLRQERVCRQDGVVCTFD
jgi:hypothetical protein